MKLNWSAKLAIIAFVALFVAAAVIDYVTPEPAYVSSSERFDHRNAVGSISVWTDVSAEKEKISSVDWVAVSRLESPQVKVNRSGMLEFRIPDNTSEHSRSTTLQAGKRRVSIFQAGVPAKPRGGDLVFFLILGLGPLMLAFQEEANGWIRTHFHLELF